MGFLATVRNTYKIMMPRSVLRIPAFAESEKERESLSKIIHVDFITKRIIRIYDVSYLAGSSINGEHIYIDRRLPKEMKLKDGRTVQIDYFLGIHEYTEKCMLDRGLLYPEAHLIATLLEREAVERAGISWEEYDAFMQYWISKTFREGYHNLPPDLEMKPEVDSQDVEILNLIKPYVHNTLLRKVGMPTKHRFNNIQHTLGNGGTGCDPSFSAFFVSPSPTIFMRNLQRDTAQPQG